MLICSVPSGLLKIASHNICVPLLIAATEILNIINKNRQQTHLNEQNIDMTNNISGPNNSKTYTQFIISAEKNEKI